LEVKAEAPCRKIIRHTKELYEYEKYFVDKIHYFPAQKVSYKRLKLGGGQAYDRSSD
jgi:hypothetical protein